ncbi:MAG: pteridine reductase [Gammaproteobacteria bacterium]|nr:pteridine reductase [Gammaproteobacteria bacterium]
MAENGLKDKAALITGGAKRIGAAVARGLHAQGMNLILHYHRSNKEAHALQTELHTIRPDSVLLIQADLQHVNQLMPMVQTAMDRWKRLDALVNNASVFFPTPAGRISESDWDTLMGVNLKAPFFLSQAAAPYLAATRGSIINMADIYAERPLKSHPVYSMTKAGVVTMTKALARELGPKVRVNGIAPGIILWPKDGPDEVAKQRMISGTVLKRHGDPEDIARTAVFLLRDADYITGQIITVDGGRVLTA